MSTGNSSTYRTLDLVKAICFGWAEHYGLKETEVQVLEFIALRGKRNESEMSFAWFPLGGQEWWASERETTMRASRASTIERSARERTNLGASSGSSRRTRAFARRVFCAHLVVRGVGHLLFACARCDASWGGGEKDEVRTTARSEGATGSASRRERWIHL